MTNEKSCDWWNALLGDDELFTDVRLPAHVTDQQFISLLEQISGRLESLDCSECRRLSQEAFITLARTRIILPRLRHLTVPSDLTLPNAVYETLANSECLPALQCLDNIQPAPTCDPLRCQSYFKRSDLRILTDSPVSCYGRARRLLTTDSGDHRQRRHRWESDLAKAAISCCNVDTYRCIRGLGYVDDKSLERLSVLFPRLACLELRLCSITDDGLTRFLHHNQRQGGLTGVVLDHAGDITDTGIMRLAEHSAPKLSQLSLARCPHVTNAALSRLFVAVYAFSYLLSQCAQLTELSVDQRSSRIGSGDTGLQQRLSAASTGQLTTTTSSEVRQHQHQHHSDSRQQSAAAASLPDAISTHCKQLTVLRLYAVNDTDCSSNLGAIWSNCTELRSVTLHHPPHLNDSSLLLMTQRCRHLAELSVNSQQLTPRGIIAAMMRASKLQRLCVCGNRHLQEPMDVTSLAEETYNQLSDDVTCRASALKSLVLTSCSGDVVQLLTALCSQLLHLQLTDCTQGSSSGWSDALWSNVLDNCPQLRTLDISSLQSAVTDRFLVNLCDKAVHLRRLSIYLGSSGPISVDLLTTLVQVCPSLAELYLTRSGSDVTVHDNVVEQVVGAVIEYHGGRCHRVNVSCTAAGNCHQIQLTFTPLKLLRTVSQFCPAYFA